MAVMLKFHKTYKTIKYNPYSAEVEQTVPEVGLVFSIRDNGFGSGDADAYVVTAVGKDNAYGLPKKICAKRLHKTFPYPSCCNGEYTISEDGTECLVVDSKAEEFSFRRRIGEAYYNGDLAFLRWGTITKSNLYNK